ncbi:MAG: DNA methyltransferase [Chloroflexi bacterium]|nr:DNA methyltransferase [Chloroflexota bacterium]
MRTAQLELLTNSSEFAKVRDWTFIGASTRELTHCYHDYPARMIPQVAGKLLDMFAAVDATMLFDPYCGTGTSLVEGLIRGLNMVGTDLNPLARLIAQAKTSLLDLDEVDKQIAKFNRFAIYSKPQTTDKLPCILGIRRLEFWFKPNVIAKLQCLKEFVDEIDDGQVQLFFKVVFSETVRESSNTRNDEFKLYRYDAEYLRRFNPDVFGIMAAKLKRNRVGLQKFLTIMHNFKQLPKASVYDFNTVQAMPQTKVAPASVDIVVTSPPYGDSHTTVAYGQYSRLSAAWLELQDPDKIDNKLMGGKIYRKIPEFPCEPLTKTLKRIRDGDEKRALEVAAFYADLYDSISNVAEVIKPGGYACYVIGNRKVKGVILPTDSAIRNFFEACDFDYIDTFHRAIPNKRMPLRNSPTNAPGVVDNTMLQEQIVVMRRRIPRAIGERRTKKSLRSKAKRRFTY